MVPEDTDTAPENAATPDAEKLPCITALNCSPHRTVFTEDDNDGGWISTDTTVEVAR